MTGRRCNGVNGSSTGSDGSECGRSLLINDRGRSSAGSVGSAGIAGNNGKPPPSSPATAAGRCDAAASAPIVRPPTTPGAASAAVIMHVKKSWKNAVVTLLAVAAITTATAAFYFNYEATATCCAVALPQLTTVFLPPSNTATNSESDELSRAKFGSSVLHASKLYVVCKTQNYSRVSHNVSYRIFSKRTYRGCL